MHPSLFHVRVWLGLALQPMCAVADVLNQQGVVGDILQRGLTFKTTFENIYLHSALRLSHQAIEPEVY